MTGYYAARTFSARAGWWETGDPVDISVLTPDERTGLAASGAIVRSKFVSTAARLAAANPVMGAGVLGLETDTGVARIGDGVTHYSDLPMTGAAAAVATALAADTAFTGTYAPYGQGVKATTGQGTKALAKSTTGPQKLKVVALGDSVAYFKWRWTYPLLKGAWGGADPGASVSSGQSGTGWSLFGTTVQTTTGTVTTTTMDYDAWWSGVTERYAEGATRTYGTGGANAWWDTAKVYYIKGPSSPDGGTFKLQVDGVDEAGFTSVSASNVTVTLGIATITRGSVAQRSLGVVNLTGVHRIVGVRFERSDVGGVILSGIAQGGINMGSGNTPVALANLATYLADFAPDIISWEMKEDRVYGDQTTFSYRMSQLMDTCQAAAPGATFVGIGSTPTASSDDTVQVPNNLDLQALCMARSGWAVYWDGYSPVAPYARLTALGWNGDGTHVADQANAFLGGLMIRDLGLLDHPALNLSTAGIIGTNLRASSRLDIGDIRADGSAVATAALQQADPDTKLLVRRELQIVPTTGATDAQSWLLRPDNSSDQQMPHGVRIGATGPYIQQGGTKLQVMSARGGGNKRDIDVRAVLQGINTLAGQSGAVTLDLSAASVHVVNLTGNVTSLTFSNADDRNQVEIHFVQDATGSRTLSGVNASIKLAGGSLTLTTIASKRDVLVLRLIGGSYYEVSRTLNVG